MPSHKTHSIIAKKILGYTRKDVDRLMDSTTDVSGPAHRNDFIHNPFMIFALTGDAKAFKAAVVHQMIDKVFTDAKRKTKNKTMRAWLDAF